MTDSGVTLIRSATSANVTNSGGSPGELRGTGFTEKTFFIFSPSVGQKSGPDQRPSPQIYPIFANLTRVLSAALPRPPIRMQTPAIHRQQPPASLLSSVQTRNPVQSGCPIRHVQGRETASPRPRRPSH